MYGLYTVNVYVGKTVKIHTMRLKSVPWHLSFVLKNEVFMVQAQFCSRELSAGEWPSYEKTLRRACTDVSSIKSETGRHVY